jgi:RNA polymerase sigma factor (sigma-70 family)
MSVHRFYRPPPSPSAALWELSDIEVIRQAAQRGPDQDQAVSEFYRRYRSPIGATGVRWGIKEHELAGFVSRVCRRLIERAKELKELNATLVLQEAQSLVPGLLILECAAAPGPNQEAAWSELISRYGQAIRAAGRSRGYPADDMDGFVYEVIACLIERRTRFRDLQSACVRKVARNLATDHWRHEQTQAHSYVDASLEDIIAAPRQGKVQGAGQTIAVDHHPNATVQPEANRVIDRVDIWRLLDQLPTSTADMLVLRFFDEWTEQEVAARWGKSAVSVRQLLFRARRSLREALASSQAS